jgi:KaiC/GvpD/RAD55 family RecA-like ATPase
VQAILDQVHEQEIEYDWLGAIRSLKKALSLIPERDVSGTGEIYERLGRAFYHAAMQAESIGEFETRCAQSIDDYEKAKELYGKEANSGKRPWMLRCDAIIAYLKHWLTPEVREKEKILDECWRLTKEALNSFEETGDAREYGKTYNQLSVSALFRFFYDWNFQTRERTVREAANIGEKAIKYLSNVGDPYELAKAYVRTATYREMLGFYFLDLSERETDYQKALEYWLKANELSEEAAHIELLNSFALAALESLNWEWGTDTTLTNFSKALKYGRKTKDRLIVGCALDWLAFHILFKAEACETPDEMVELFKNALQYSKDAKQQYLPISLISPLWGALWTEAPYAYYYWDLATYEADPKKKRDLLEKAAEAASDQLKRSEGSGYPEVLMFAHHTSSDIFLSLARIERNASERKRLLEKALTHQNEAIGIIKQFIPFYYWKRGKMQTFVADIKSELADLVKEPEVKKSILQEAVLDKENSLKLAIKYAEFWEGKGSIPTLFANLGNWQYGYGDMLNRLYEFSRNSEHLRKAIAAFEEASETFKKLNLSSRVAECYWMEAQTCDTLGEHLRSASNFGIASDNYLRAAEKMPHLKDFYQEHAFYMHAWSEIEKAKFAHKQEEYAAAMKHFEEVADLLERSKRWSYLYSNFLAWSLLEQAEDLSRKGSGTEAIEAFNKAAKLFKEAKDVFRKEIDKIQNLDEKEKAIELSDASARREDYCLARVNVEEARIFDQKGDYAESAKKYELAAVTFEKILETVETQAEQEEIRPIVFMCRAWQKMKIADVMVSPELYHEASELFLEAKEHTTRERTILLASGNGAFCEALEHGTKFEATREKADFLRVKQHLESAASYYLKAGYDNASLWTNATEILFDAYTYMINAEIEVDPDRKMKTYLLAEKCLEKSAEFYETAGYVGKRDEVLKTLRKVKEKREFALSLRELLTVPSEASSTSLIPALIMAKEEPVGVSKFEGAFVQANLIARKTEATVCENCDLSFQFVNIGKNPALLIRIEGIIPDGLDLIDEPEIYRLEDSGLNMKGKRLDPLKTEELRLTVRAFEKGTFEIKPRIIYVDETGHQMSCEPEPITINISKVVLPEHIATGCGDLDNLLLGGIPEKYSVLLTSPSCDERDLLIHRFLEAGARKGEVTFYATVDASNVKALAEECQTNFYLFVCNPRADEIIKSLPNVFKLKGVENLTEITIALTSAVSRLDASIAGSKRACIEIISDALLQHHAVSTRRWLTSIIPELRSRGFTTLAVMNPQMHHLEEVQAILDLFEGEINIYEKETRKGLGKFVRIKKMYNQRYLESELFLKKERLKC